MQHKKMSHFLKLLHRLGNNPIPPFSWKFFPAVRNFKFFSVFYLRRFSWYQWKISTSLIYISNFLIHSSFSTFFFCLATGTLPLVVDIPKLNDGLTAWEGVLSPVYFPWFLDCVLFRFLSLRVFVSVPGSQTHFLRCKQPFQLPCCRNLVLLLLFFIDISFLTFLRLSDSLRFVIFPC